jgi:cytochrome c
MKSFELNKIAGAVLGTLTFVMLLSFGGELLFHERPSAKAGYDLPMPAGTAVAVAAAPAAAAVDPIAVRLASADPAKGENVFKQCATCHTPDKGGANKIGPNMWNVLGRLKGQVVGFNYSNALKAMAAKGDKWDFETIDKFVENPKGYIPGTAMSFAGIANPRTRADLISYLNKLNDSPLTITK